jgi:hypothetical protein
MKTTAIRAFLRDHYSDERLAMLLAHAEGGKLAFYSCCCFIGVATANHDLCGKANRKVGDPLLVTHYMEASTLPGSAEAEEEYYELDPSDTIRRRLIIPIIREEMARREKVRAESIQEQEAEAVKA